MFPREKAILFHNHSRVVKFGKRNIDAIYDLIFCPSFNLISHLVSVCIWPMNST